jgi:hypothetical protein
MNDTLFSRSFLLSAWASDYSAYCASGEDKVLLTRLQNWSERESHKETSAEKAFIQTFFTEVWGYNSAGAQAKNEGFNLYPQFKVAKAGQGGGTGEADLAIGWFGMADIPPTPQVLCEFKDDRSGLDAAQNRKGNDRSPVKQCADYLKFAAEEHTPYGNEKIQPIWGIVTDMNEFRLYWRSRMPLQYERFVIKGSPASNGTTPLIDETEAARVQRFLFQRLFQRDALLSLSGESSLLALLARQRVQESRLEKGFYFEYRDYRLTLYRALLSHNPQYKTEPRTLVRLTQKLLDRFLFILFCEDMGARLDYPHNLLRDILTAQSRDEYFNPVECDLWTGKVKQIFNTMRDGGTFGPHTLNRFNGGMFAIDNALDTLVVPNQIFCAKNQGASDASMLQHTDTLLYFAAHYNFGIEDGGERAVGLYTLGRIFEQSITDLEIMEAEAANEQSLMKLSKRKTDGVYYTPEWVTAYLVEETLGRMFNDIRAVLITDEFATIDAALVEAEHTKTNKFKKKDSLCARYFVALEKYAQRIAKIKVLDPACGSGAFLIQALKRFVAEYEWINFEKSRVSYAYRQSGLFDRARAYNDILGNNLYGVDINAESVEITKLALWLHTALPGQPLSSLDGHIVCGNSLVDWDIEAVLGKKFTEDQKQRINPFSYAAAFPEVFAAGGFDILIGNPPYIKLQNMRVLQSEATDYWVKAKNAEGTPHFSSAQTGNYDIYLLFIEQGCRLLKPTGKMGFINPNVWPVNEYGQGLRDWLSVTRQLDRWVDFKSYQIFDEAITYTALQFFSGQPTAGVRLHFAPHGGGDLSSLDWQSVATLPWDELPKGQTWEFMPEEERALIAKLGAVSKPLSACCKTIFQGLITSADNIYHLTRLAPGKYRSYANKSGPFDVDIEDDLMRPLVSGTEAKRYQQPQTDTWLLFPYALDSDKPKLYSEQDLKAMYPKGWHYLQHHEKALRSRESHKFDGPGWHQFGRNQSIDKQEIPKLMIPRLVTKLFCAIDASGTFFLDNVDVGGVVATAPEDLHFLAAILNAPPANFVWRRISKPFQNDYRSANKQFIAPLPIPHADAAQKLDIGQLASELQQLHSAYRDEVQELTRLLHHEQMLPDTARQTPYWLWPGLTQVDALKKSTAAQATKHKGAALTRWANDQVQAVIDKKLLKLSARLIPSVTLAVTDSSGEIALHANGVKVLSVFESDKDAPFIAAQWRQVLRTTTVTPGLTAPKLLDRLLALQTTSVPALHQRIMDVDAKLTRQRTVIDEKESSINRLIYALYRLSTIDIRRIEQG